jgi:hypothetical protein
MVDLTEKRLFYEIFWPEKIDLDIKGPILFGHSHLFSRFAVFYTWFASATSLILRLSWFVLRY